MVFEEDTRAMVRLLGKIVVINGPPAEKRRQLMRGICELIGGGGVWARLGRTEEGETVTFALKHQGGLSEQQLIDFMKAQEHPDMTLVNGPLFAQYTERGSHLTRTDWQIISIEDYTKTEVPTLFEKANLGPAVLSLYPIEKEQTSGIIIFRKVGEDPFSARESRIAHILLLRSQLAPSGSTRRRSRKSGLSTVSENEYGVEPFVARFAPQADRRPT